MGNGAIELLKWIALVLMTGDHIDAGFFSRNYWILSEVGRIAMPLFAAVFGYNLVRIDGYQVKLTRLRNKLLMVGAIAYPFHCLVVAHTWLALNILFAFAVAVQMQIWICSDWKKNLVKILSLFLVTGVFLEFGWVAPALVLAWSTWWRSPRISAGIALLVCYVGLAVMNQNFWAFGSLPLILLASLADPQIPRIRQIFWIYYPAHLIVLAMLMLAPAPYVSLVSVPPAGAINY